MDKPMVNLWFDVGNRCLTIAKDMIKGETAPTVATVETVGKLVNIAIAIDMLNLRWEERTPYEKAVSLGSFSQRNARGS